MTDQNAANFQGFLGYAGGEEISVQTIMIIITIIVFIDILLSRILELKSLHRQLIQGKTLKIFEFRSVSPDLYQARNELITRISEVYVQREQKFGACFG